LVSIEDPLDLGGLTVCQTQEMELGREIDAVLAPSLLGHATPPFARPALPGHQVADAKVALGFDDEGPGESELGVGEPPIEGSIGDAVSFHRLTRPEQRVIGGVSK
jgi:hypothetical protein